MNNFIYNTSWGGIAIAAVAYFIIGGFWFSRMLFGRTWERALGFERPHGWKETSIYFIGPFAGALCTSIGVGILHQFIGIDSYITSAMLGGIVGVCFSLPASIVNAINPMIKEPITYGTLTGLYHICGCVLASLIIYVF